MTEDLDVQTNNENRPFSSFTGYKSSLKQSDCLWQLKKLKNWYYQFSPTKVEFFFYEERGFENL